MSQTDILFVKCTMYIISGFMYIIANLKIKEGKYK